MSLLILFTFIKVFFDIVVKVDDHFLFSFHIGKSRFILVQRVNKRIQKLFLVDEIFFVRSSVGEKFDRNCFLFLN